MECNHDETKKVKQTSAFDVQLQKNLNQRKTEHCNRRRKNDENGSKEFPNFEALTKEEKLEFFEALSFARRNVERTGTQTRKRFNTVHDEYLEYFESCQEAVAGEIDRETPSASSCDTQATYTLNRVRDDIDVEKVASGKSFLSLPETVTLNDSNQTEQSFKFNSTVFKIAEEPATSKSFSEMQVSDEKEFRTPLSEHETIFDGREEKHKENLAKNYGNDLSEMSEKANPTKNVVANESFKQIKSFAEEEDRGIDPDDFMKIPKTNASSNTLVNKKTSNEKMKKVNSTLKFEALNPEEKKIFFSILKEAHDNVYKKETEKKISSYETILKRYEMDGAPQIEVLTSIAECRKPKNQFKEKNLRVKLTLTSTDNERLEKAVTNKLKEVDNQKGAKKEQREQKEFLKVRRSDKQDSDKVHETRLFDKKGQKGFDSNSITNFEIKKISENLDYEVNNLNLPRRPTTTEDSTTMKKRNSISDGLTERAFANGTHEGFEKRDVFRENEEIGNSEFSNTSINLTEKTNKTENEENCMENGNEEKVIRTKKSLVNLAKNENCFFGDNLTPKSETILNLNDGNELEEENEAEPSVERPIKLIGSNQSRTIVATHESNSDDECCQMTNSEKDEILPTEKEELKKTSSLCLSREIQEISVIESLSSSESSFSRSHSLMESSEKSRESKSALSVIGKGPRKKEKNEENFSFQRVNKECRSKTTYAVANETKDETTGRKITKVHASLTSPEVFLKVQQNTKKEENKKQSVTMAGLPRSISDSEIRQNTKLKEVDKTDFPEAQNNVKGSDSSLMLANPSDSDSASTTESEENPLLVPMFVKRKRLPTTKIRVLQDLLKERAKFVEGSIGEFKIVRVSHEEIESTETPTARLYVEEEDGRSEKGIKSIFLKALAKFCRCGKKDVGEEENMLENLKGEAVAVDVSKSAKSPASVTLNESTMEVLKAAERKKIIQKYWKIS